MMKTTAPKCHCPNLTGYWKGSRCCNDGLYAHADGKHYCAAHLTVVANDSARVEKTKRQWEKHQKKLGKVLTWETVFAA